MSSTRFRVNLHSKLPKFQGTPCSKQAQYLKFKWLQRDSNPKPLSLETNIQPFSQTVVILTRERRKKVSQTLSGVNVDKGYNKLELKLKLENFD